MPNLSYVDGIYYDHADSKIHINDRGYHFGDAVYEVILFNEGVFYDFDAHINRLFNSLKSIEIEFSFTKKTIELIVKNLIRLNRVTFKASQSYLKFPPIYSNPLLNIPIKY